MFMVCSSINALDFYVDGELNYTYAPGTNNPHIGPLINPLHVVECSCWWRFGGTVTTDDIFPQQYQIDYIKVYQRQSS